MTDKQYLERLSELTDQLQAAGNARPYDPDNYNRIIDEINTLSLAHFSKPNSSAVLRFLKWAGKRGVAAATRLKKILKKVVTS